MIPAYNAAAHLGECLESVAAQRVAMPLEIVVIDDASTDGTGDVAQEYRQARVIRLATNGGPSRARNAGIDAARGEWVAFLDADDVWPAGSLEARLAVLTRHPDAALVFGDCLQFDHRGPRERTEFEVGRLGACAWGASGVVPDAYARLLNDNFITTGSVLARKAVVEQVGGFADDLRLVEDLDLWLRIARLHTVAWCAEVCLLRRRHEANASRDAMAMSLAYLEVLRRQTTHSPMRDRRLLRQIAAAAAREQLHLADIAAGRNEPAGALRWALRSLLTRPSMRALWRMAQVTSWRWAIRAPKSDRG